MARVAIPSCATDRTGCGCAEIEGSPHSNLPRALILSAYQLSGRVPDHPLPGSFCQPGHPTHLSSEVLPTDSVLRAMGLVPVPPVQVQLCGTVAEPEVLDVQTWGQLQLHCGEWRGSVQSQVDSTCPGPRRRGWGAGGCSKVETTACRPETWPLSLRTPLFL